MQSRNQGPHGSTSFTVIAAASTVALAGQLTPRMALAAYAAVLAYAAYADRHGRR